MLSVSWSKGETIWLVSVFLKDIGGAAVIAVWYHLYIAANEALSNNFHKD